MSDNIEIYQSIEGKNSVEVIFDNDTVWLTQAQMVDLFEKTKQNISLHINNCFKEGELDKESTVKEYLTVQNEGNREINRKIKLYSLDVIISVGYRVKSQKGTQFRIWAIQVLRNHILQGYTINQHRLEQKEQEVQILKNGIQILSRAIEEKAGDNHWLQEFSNGLKLLDDYDHETLDSKGLSKAKAIYPSMEDYQELIEAMISDFDSKVFGKTKDDNFSSSINQITKGMDTEDFYPTLEEKAATLLYLVVKNHSFVDGNKRIAAACFLKFLAANKVLFQVNRTPIISNDTLASLTLFIASSKPEEMKTVKQLVISVLNRNRISNI